MDNQHRQIKGYRELSQEEIDLMNEIKAAGLSLEALILKAQTQIQQKYAAMTKMDGAYYEEGPKKDEWDRLLKANPFGWLQQGQLDLQTGLMKLTRSVAQPTFF